MSLATSASTTGKIAEKKACNFLIEKGYRILSRNWRTKLCEIDIVATKDKTVFFVEVKYRKQTAQGSGLDYITFKKQKQMKFAAEIWVHEFKWPNDYSLAAIEVSGPEFGITAFEAGFL